MTTAICPQASWAGLEELRPLLCWHLAHSTANEADIDDVVQETFLRAARYRDRLLSEDSLRPWLLRIAFNVLRDRARRESRLPRLDDGDDALEIIEGRESIPGDAPEEWLWVGPREPVERGSAVRLLCRAVSALSEGDRQLIGQYYGEDLSCEQAARVCETSTAVVRIRLHRARQKLLRRLRPHFEPQGPAVEPCGSDPVPLRRGAVPRPRNQPAHKCQLEARRGAQAPLANELRAAGCGPLSLNRTCGRIGAAESAS